jgi:hypothetical protein
MSGSIYYRAEYTLERAHSRHSLATRFPRMNTARDNDEFPVVGTQDAHPRSEMKVQRIFA